MRQIKNVQYLYCEFGFFLELLYDLELPVDVLQDL